MNRGEFKQAVDSVLPKDKEVPEYTDRDYEIIEYVYNFHPSISETQGRKQIAELFVNFGMTLINDMVPRAELMEKKEKELSAAREAIRKIEKEIKDIRAGKAIIF